MPCLEVQKDQNSAQKTLLSNLGKDAENNLGCNLMVVPVGRRASSLTYAIMAKGAGE